MTIWWPLALLVCILWTFGTFVAGYQFGANSRDRKGKDDD